MVTSHRQANRRGGREHVRAERLEKRRSYAPATVVAVLLGGIGLRVAFCLGNDYRNTYDDHFHVIALILKHHRLPDPAEGWQCYQPPLYHLVGAAVYATARSTAQAAGLQHDRAHRLGRKAVQFTSAVYGIATLWACLAVLRRLFPTRRDVHAMGLAAVALLPRHIYMSGMATNDALTYMLAAWTVYGLVRWHQDRWALRWAVLAGLMGGLTCAAKQYGLVIVLVGAGALVGSFACQPSRAGRSRLQLGLRGTAIMIGLVALLGAGPYLRNYWLYGNPLLSNTDLWPGAHGFGRPPASVGAISFTSFRLPALLAKPWVHASHVASFWSEIYARMWFDYEDTLTRWQYRPWRRYYDRIWTDRRLSVWQKWDRQLNWPDEAVDPTQANQARALYLLGLLPTAMVLAGLVGSLGRWRRSWPDLLMSLLFIVSLLPPIYQTLRFPNYTCMKAAFSLTLLPAAAVFFARSYQWLAGQRWAWMRWLPVANMLLLAAVLLWHVVIVAFLPARYFAPLEPP